MQNIINDEDEVLSTEFTKESKKIGSIKSKAKLDRKESENISGSDSEAEKFPPKNDDANSGNGFECDGELAFVATTTHLDAEVTFTVHDVGCTPEVSQPSLFKNIWLGDSGASYHMTKMMLLVCLIVDNIMQ